MQAHSSFAVPIAIIIAGAFIAGAVYLSGSNSPRSNEEPATVTAPTPSAVTPESVPPVTENDHIRGNPNAPVVIIEYSDYDCPFCKNYHETMNAIMAEYGITGQVAWVYRHFPLQQLHPNAPAIAAAAECVAADAGNDAFWTFSDLVFGERSTNEPTDVSRLGEFATTAGADLERFEACVRNGDHNEKVTASLEEAIAAGGRGTPHSFVLVGDQQGVINGAQPYEVVSQIIEELLAQLEGGGGENTIELDAS